MSYQTRQIKVEFTLENGGTFDGRGNILTLENGRCFASIAAYGGMAGTELTLQVWGLSIPHMAALSARGVWIRNVPQNRLRVWAGGHLIFEGFITDAYADYNQLPDVPLVVTANMQFYLRAQEVAPFSASGDVQVADVIRAMASLAGLGFENTGVTATLSNPAFRGNIVQQMVDAARAAGCEIDVGMEKVSIWPQGGTRGGEALYASPDNGLIGYPVFTNVGLAINTLFSPEIYNGRLISVETSLPNASGQYLIIGAQHSLTSWTEGGQWSTSASVQPYGDWWKHDAAQA